MAEKGNVTIISSLLNFAPLHAVTWSANKLGDRLRAAGYAGMAYIPIHSRLEHQIHTGHAVGGLITATHQPFREETGWAIWRKAARRLPNPLAAAFQLAMDLDMVPLSKGDAEAALVQAALPRKVPHVVHPNGQLLGDELHPNSTSAHNKPRDYRTLAASGTVGELQWQPTAELAVSMGIDLRGPAPEVAEEMVHKARSVGLSRRTALDLGHVQAVRHGRFFGEASSLHRIDYMAGLVGALAANGNVGCIEFDIQSNLGSSPDTLKTIMNGGLERTPQGSLYIATLQSMPPGEDVVVKTEIPQREFTAIGMNYQYGHEQLAPYLVDTAVNYLPAAA